MERVPTGIDWTIGDTRYFTRDETTNADYAITFTVQSGVVAPVIIGDAVVPYDGIIHAWQVLSDGTASAVFDVWKESAAAYPPDALNTITAAAKPTLVSGTFAEATDLASWDNTVTKGDILRIYLDSQTNLQRVMLVLYIARPGVLIEALPLLDTKADITHNHDTVYYPRTELDTKLTTDGFLDIRYYTETEIDGKFAAISGSHSHDDLYYPRADVDNALNTKANTSHSHAANQIVSGEFDAARIPALDAAKITTGTFTSPQIPALDAGKITTGIFDAARVPQLDATKIGSGTLAVTRIPTGTTSTTVSTGDRGLPTGGAAGTLLGKSSSTNYATAWLARNLPRGGTFQNNTLTTIDVASGVSTTSGSLALTVVDGQSYLIDVLGIITAYGDLATNGESIMRLEVTGVTSAHTADSALYLYVQGVTSPNVSRTVTGIVAAGTTVTITLKHIQYAGAYTVRMQQLTATLTPYNTFI